MPTNGRHRDGARGADSSADARLDRLGRGILRASAADAAEAEAVAASPFLYSRVRARINAERERREAGEGWGMFLSVLWRSAPAMALVAVVAFVMFWSAVSNSQPGGLVVDETLLGQRENGIEQVVFADRTPLSSDDVLATIINDDRENSK